MTNHQFSPPPGKCKVCGFSRWTGGQETGLWRCGCCKTVRNEVPVRKPKRHIRNWRGKP